MAFHENVVSCRRGALRVAAVLTAILLLAVPAVAQVVPGSKPNPKLRPRRTGIVTDLREKNFGTIDAPQFEEYFNDYFLQQFAQTPESRSLGELRIELRNQYFGTGRSGPPYTRLNELTFAFMRAILAGDFDMDIKYNAMMVIADLNESEGDIGAKPKPYSPALDLMIKVYRSPKAPDFLRIPALLGITRHAELHSSYPMSATQRETIMRAMVDLLNERKPPENRNAEAQAWLRRMAAQILGNMGEPGMAANGTDIAKLLWATMRDAKDDNPWSVRFAAAQALGDLKLPTGEKLDVQGMCVDALDLLTSFAKAEVAQAKEDGTEPNRRRLWTAYTNVKSILAGQSGKPGLLAALPEAKRDALLTPMRTVFAALQKVLDKNPVPLTELLAILDKLEGVYKQFRKGAGIAAPAAEGRPRVEDRSAGAVTPVQASPVPAAPLR